MTNKQTSLQPLVSIIMPCFNHEEFVAETLDSVGAQTYSNWECIIVDDGSTDKSKEVCMNFVDNDKRYKYFYQKNKGPAAARNFGLKLSKGDFIVFLDSDDLISNDKLERQIGVFFENPEIDIVYGDYICFSNEDRSKKWTYSRVELKDDIFKDFIQNWEKGLSIPIHCFFYKRECLVRNGGFDEFFLNSNEDWDLHLKLSFSSAIFFYLKGTVAFYRVCISKLSRARDERLTRKDKYRLFKKYFLKRETSLIIKLILLKRYIENLRDQFYQTLG